MLSNLSPNPNLLESKMETPAKTWPEMGIKSNVTIF